MRALIIGLLWLGPTCLAAQRPETLVDGDIRHGGFGGPAVALTQIANEAGVLVGGNGAWLLNKTFFIGGGGMGLVTNVPEPNPVGNTPRKLNFGYAGFVAGYISGSDLLVHWKAHVLLGAGAVSYRDQGATGPEPFFIAEPVAVAELNVAQSFRLAAGLTYRYIAGVDMPGLTADDLMGPSLIAMITFGGF